MDVSGGMWGSSVWPLSVSGLGVRLEPAQGLQCLRATLGDRELVYPVQAGWGRFSEDRNMGTAGRRIQPAHLQ